MTKIAAPFSIVLSEIHPLLSHPMAGLPHRKHSLSSTSFSLGPKALCTSVSACHQVWRKFFSISLINRGKYLSLKPRENRVDSEFPCKGFVQSLSVLHFSRITEAPQLWFWPRLWQKGTTLGPLDLFFLPAWSWHHSLIPRGWGQTQVFLVKAKSTKDQEVSVTIHLLQPQEQCLQWSLAVKPGF